MKHSFTLRHLLALAVLISLVGNEPAIASGKPARKYLIEDEEKPAKKAKAKNKTKAFASLNNSAVKIYPDVIKRDMHVVAKDNDGKTIDFFVFDANGAIVHHTKMNSKDHTKLTGLARGTYVYRVFCGDEEKATGNFEIR